MVACDPKVVFLALQQPLQALISLPEVCHLLRCLNPDPPLSLTPSDTPLTDAL